MTYNASDTKRKLFGFLGSIQREDDGVVHAGYGMYDDSVMPAESRFRQNFRFLWCRQEQWVQSIHWPVVTLTINCLTCAASEHVVSEAIAMTVDV